MNAWVASIEASPPLVADSLRRHDAVTSAALDTGTTPLPVRFGEVFDSDAACVASLSARMEELLYGLTAVDGKVEMTIAIPLDAAAPSVEIQPVDAVEPGPGRAYLERLRSERHASQILQQQGHVWSRPLIHAVRHLVADERATFRSPPPVYLVSHLISRDAVGDYVRLATVAIGKPSDSERTRAIIRGPSAPYSFAGAGR